MSQFFLTEMAAVAKAGNSSIVNWILLKREMTHTSIERRSPSVVHIAGITQSANRFLSVSTASFVNAKKCKD